MNIRRPVAVAAATVLLLLSLACKKEEPSVASPPPEKGERYAYVDSLVGLIARANPARGAKVLTVLPYRTRLKIKSRDPRSETIDGLVGFWTEVELEQGGTGWVFDAYLSTPPPTQYYKVMARGGLRLRERPALDGKVLGLLPHYHVGEILLGSAPPVKIDGLRGFWFQTAYEEKTGWIFSGYTITGRDGLALTRDRILDPVDEPLAAAEESLEQLLAGWTVQNSRRIKNYTVYETTQPSDDGCGPKRRILFHNRDSGSVFFRHAYSETLRSEHWPLPDTIFTEYLGCCMCCPDEGSRLYFLEREGVRSVFIADRNNLTGSCSYNLMGDGTTLYSEKRAPSVAPAEQTYFFLRRKRPRCPPAEEVSDATRSQGLSIEPGVYEHELFAVLRFQNQVLKIEAFKDQGIPPRYAEEWRDALLLPSLSKPGG